MSRKKFKDTKVGQFLLEKIPSVVGSLAGDTPVGSVVKALIGGSEMSEADKEIALKKLDQEIHEFDGITRRWVADARSGSWLASNVRPLTLAFLTVSFVLGWYYQLEGLEKNSCICFKSSISLMSHIFQLPYLYQIDVSQGFLNQCIRDHLNRRLV